MNALLQYAFLHSGVSKAGEGGGGGVLTMSVRTSRTGRRFGDQFFILFV